MVLDGKSSKEYPVNVGVPQDSIFGPTFLLLYIYYLPDIISDISKCGQASDLWQQLALASELESDLRDTVDRGCKRSADFKAGKTQQVLFDQSYNTGAIDMKNDGLFLMKNHLLR